MVYLIVAGLSEVACAVGLECTEGFTRDWPNVVVGLVIVVSLAILAIAFRTISIGTGYAMWTRIGVVGTAILGVLLFKRSVNSGELVSSH